jgi:hypothetical protein
MSPEHVPAPQLASPAGAAFGAAAFLVPSFAGDLPDGDTVEAAAAAGAPVVAVDTGVGAAVGGVGDATLAGIAAALGEPAAGPSAFMPCVLPEQPFAEHEA